MDNYHSSQQTIQFRIGDRFLGYSRSEGRWVVLEARDHCPNDYNTLHFTPVAFLPECKVNPRAWDFCIYQ